MSLKKALAEETRGQRARRLELQEATVGLLGNLELAGVKSPKPGCPALDHLHPIPGTDADRLEMIELVG